MWDHTPFMSLHVKNALKAVELQIRHVPDQKDAVTPKLLKNILCLIRKRSNGNMMALAIIIMFQAFLRQSNLLPRCVAAFDPTRQLTSSDVKVRGGVLSIQVKWSKTQQKLGDNREINLHSIPGSPLCPVAAFRAASMGRRRHTPDSPLITFRDGNPMTLGYVKKAWAAVLKSLCRSARVFSLHSLRRGGTSYVSFQGQAKMTDLRRHGGWSSEAVRAYLKPPKGFVDSVQAARQQL